MSSGAVLGAGWRRAAVALTMVLALLWTSAAAAQKAAEKRITPQQSEELFRSVDEILQFVSQDTGLAIQHKVERRMLSREQLTATLRQKMAEDPELERMERSAETMQHLGMLPKGFQLREQVLSLLTEQVAAFYDPKTGYVNLLDWVPIEEQKMVLSHELTHALQDQAVGLSAWEMDADKRKLSFAEQIQRDEQREARSAVAEGQATLVMLDYLLKGQRMTALEAPQVIDMAAAITGAESSPELAKAPLLLRESMIFPYTRGLKFVFAALKERGREAAYAGMLKHPPADTHQVMHPEAYLAGAAANKLASGKTDQALGAGWARYDDSGVGEHDLWMIEAVWGDKNFAEAHAKAWRGGYYVAYKRKGDEKGKLHLGLMMKFDSDEEAAAFDELYRRALAKRFKDVKNDGANLQSEEGSIAITRDGALWAASESFPLLDGAKLRRAMLDAAKAK